LSFNLILGCIAGNKLFYGVINELISSELIPRTAERLGKLHASGLGMKGQSMERFVTQANLSMLMQAILILSPVVSLFIVDEACLRHYILLVGDLDQLVSCIVVRSPSEDCWIQLESWNLDVYGTVLSAACFSLLSLIFSLSHCDGMWFQAAYRHGFCSRQLVRTFLYVSGCHESGQRGDGSTFALTTMPNRL
jgi:hypothetical protein